LGENVTPEYAKPGNESILICLDAETGELKALVGGRNYGVSQLDHALRIRQPGL